MLSPKQIQERLADANLRKVAERLDMHYMTLWRFMRGHGEPMYSTVKALSDYLEVQHNDDKS